jgi:hypothetical protein
MEGQGKILPAAVRGACRALVLLLPLLLPSALLGASLEVSWDPNTEDDLAGYAIYYGKTSGDYTDSLFIDEHDLTPVGGRLYYIIDHLDSGTTYYVALKAYDTSDNLSDFSNEDSYTTGGQPPDEASSAGGGGGGCFIATAAYGSGAARQVQILRQFRDAVLLTCRPGRQFVSLYYRFSPPLASYVDRHPWLRTTLRPVLCPLVGLAALWPQVPSLLPVLLAASLLLLAARRAALSLSRRAR